MAALHDAAGVALNKKIELHLRLGLRTPLFILLLHKLNPTSLAVSLVCNSLMQCVMRCMMLYNHALRCLKLARTHTSHVRSGGPHHLHSTAPR